MSSASSLLSALPFSDTETKVEKSTPRQSPPPIPLSQKFVVGASAGILGTSIIYPIDLLKTRLQSATGDSFYSTVVRVFRSGGLYRGFSACLVGIAPEKAIKLAVNDGVRDYFMEKNALQRISLSQEIIAGSVAGFLQLFVTVPYESVKIQMQMATAGVNGERESALSVLRRMGPVGMYRGFVATLCRDVPFCLLFFPLYSKVKEVQMAGPVLRHDFSPAKEPFHVGLVAGLVSGAISAALVTPADMLKTRIQQKMNGNLGFLQYASQVAQTEGAASLFRGWQARVMVIAPLYGIVSLAFEVQKQWLSSEH